MEATEFTGGAVIAALLSTCCGMLEGIMVATGGANEGPASAASGSG